MKWTPHPMCAVCKHPVVMMHRIDDPQLHRVTFVAECHGETEETVIDLADLQSGLVDLTPGTAFQKAKAISSC